MVVAALLLPPGLMCLLLVLGRYEEWLLKQPARHAHRKRHLALVPPVPPTEPQPERDDHEGARPVADAA
ncbi:hypothetical protein WBG99_32355 [Streptomyces sp. TG1A-60]|uniref:hypothetical protein n=1 Tax=Streptomyces sp. TG1A-60 TaxID=3129111 RepID=UPI0030D03C84